MKKSQENSRLKCQVKNNQIVISCGINTLTWAFEHSNFNNQFCGKINDYIQQYKVNNKKGFAQDVCDVLNNEQEDGTTRLHLLLDEAYIAALDNGSMHVDEVNEISDETPMEE